MTKIAITLDENGNIISYAPYPYSMVQDPNKGWILVDENQNFNINEKYLWTIRKSDNKLVYISDSKTPEERSQVNITALTQDGLATKMTTVQLQAAVTSLTKSNLQLTLDNATLKTDRDQLKSDRNTQQQAITQITTELMAMKVAATQQSTSSADTTKTK